MKKNICYFLGFLLAMAMLGACTKPDGAEKENGVDLEDLETVLNALDDNDADNPYTIKLAAGTEINNGDDPKNVWSRVHTVVLNAKKYIALDLSDCIATGDKVFGAETPTNNQMNIIKSNRYIKGIVLPDSLKTVGDHAFNSCQWLFFVNVPYGVDTIGERAFYNCSKIKELPISDSVKSIGKYAYYWLELVKEITVPEGVTVIQDGTFYHCWGASAFNLPQSLETIGASVFSGNLTYFTAIIIPKNVTTIGKRAFTNCCELTSVTFEAAGTTIMDAAESSDYDKHWRNLGAAYAEGGAGTYTREAVPNSPNANVNQWTKKIE